MKKILGLCLLILFSSQLDAQQPVKQDVIFKSNGEELSGKVIEINDNEVRFSYAGETLVYTIKKADIFKINYASGRTELFNKTSSAATGTGLPVALKATTEKSTEVHTNRVAVLPFSYIADGQPGAGAINEKVQSVCYSYLTKNAGAKKILDPRTTNALLLKAGITGENIKSFTMDDLCDRLGVEYVVEGIVTVNKSGVTSSQHGSGNSTTKSGDKSNDKDKQSNFSSSSTAEQEYETSVNLSIYSDKGNNIYNQDRKSILSSQGAYKSTLEYLLKRCPLYAK